MTVTLIATKQDMSRWARAHADVPTVNWSVQAGPGGTMIIIEPGDRSLPAEDRMDMPEVTA